MNKYLKNLHGAPRSTILAIIMFCALTWMQVAKIMDKDVYLTLAPVVIGFAFTDILGEKGRKQARELTKSTEPEEGDGAEPDYPA